MARVLNSTPRSLVKLFPAGEVSGKLVICAAIKTKDPAGLMALAQPVIAWGVFVFDDFLLLLITISRTFGISNDI
ncbi:hypothetical protein [Leptolyngbya sp. BL0902]|uniref:hypothetical protein n=1 Tax=Leptolyngbya sp. BL0902 TaxID=1115757 RepID=UPI0018E6E168|nr:hypothetical protein [Leptolyngbya sp. BL0902]